MTLTKQTGAIHHSRSANDILLDLFVEQTIGSLDHELEDWSDGITDISLYEDSNLWNHRAGWNYFPAADQQAPQPQPGGAVAPSGIVHFPSSELPLCA